MSSKKKKDSSELVKVVLDYPSHYEGVEYEPGEHEVGPETAKRLAEINKFLVKENK